MTKKQKVKNMLYKILQKIEPRLRIIYQKLYEPPIPNLRGDRDVEYSWICANMPSGPGEALDFGCGTGWMGLLAARKGFNVIAIDLEPVTWYYVHPKLKFIQGDLLKVSLPLNYFDLVINVSAIEHVGLTGRYSVTEEKPDGDLEAMKVIYNIMKKGGIMLLTIPVGKDRVFKPFHRIYGTERLPKLLQGFEIIAKEFWVKDKLNRYIYVDEEIALNNEPLEHCYGLGLFVLKKPL